MMRPDHEMIARGLLWVAAAVIMVLEFQTIAKKAALLLASG